MDGWKYVRLNDQQLSSDLKSKVGIVYCLRQCDDALEAIGSSFRVHFSPGFFIFVTAAHVLNEALRRALPKRFVSTYFADIPDHIVKGALQRIFVYFDGLDTKNLPSIHTLYFNEGSDLGCFIVKNSATEDNPYPLVFPIDSDQLAVGSKVISMGVVNLELSSIKEKETGSVYAWQPSLQPRYGEVIKVLSKGRLVKVPVYETSIPFTPGMSGGPVVLSPDSLESPIKVVGVISSDISTRHSHQNAGSVGTSYVIPIAFLYGLKSGVSVGRIEDANFKTLIGEKAVLDFGKNQHLISTEYSAEGNLVITPFDSSLFDH